MSEPRITILSFSSASPAEVTRGLLGWICIVVEELLRIDGLTLRLTRSGELALSFPAPKDHRGRRQSLVRPVDDAARRAIERAVLRALERRGAA